MKINFKKSITLLALPAVFMSCGEQPANTSLANSTATYAGFITKDSANKMIGSYLSSLDPSSDSQLYSLIMDADELREFLEDTTIEGLKIMFAHTLEYINAGNKGQPAGYESGALTIVISGFDVHGNYVYAPGTKVPDAVKPCPPHCKINGTAASNLLE